MQAIVHRDGRLVLGGRVLRAALGRGGVRADKREGDGATPAGVLPLRRVFYRADRVPPPDCAVPIEPIAPNDGWCDDVAEADYNRLVRLPHGGAREELWRQDARLRRGGRAGLERRASAARVRLGDFFACRAGRLCADRRLRCAGAGDLRRMLAAGLTELLVLPE